MARGPGHAQGYGGFAVGDDAITHRVDLEADPFRGRAGFTVVGFAVVVDTAHLAQAVVLFKFSRCIRVVDGVSFTATGFNHGEAWDVAGAIGDVDHVLQGDAAILWFHVRIHIDRGVFVGAFVDLEDGFGLGRVVDDHADLSDLGFGGDGELVLVEETGLKGVFDEFAGPSAIDFVGSAATADHFGEAGAHDVVLECNVVFAIFGLFLSEIPAAIEEVGHTGVEFDIRATLAQDAVVEASHMTRQDVSEEVIEVSDFTGDMITPLFVVFA